VEALVFGWVSARVGGVLSRRQRLPWWQASGIKWWQQPMPPAEPARVPAALPPLQAVSEVLEESERRGGLSAAQHHALMADLSPKLQPLLLGPS